MKIFNYISGLRSIVLRKYLAVGLAVFMLAITTLIFQPVKAGIFNLEGDYGEDLYKTVYEKLKNEGSDMAMKRMLANQGLSEEELKLLISGASISEFMTLPDLKSKLSPQQIEARHAALERDLKEEKLLADLESQLNMEVTQTEIFANGDESDSGFDLISDLDLIDEILFGRNGDEGGDGRGSGGGNSGGGGGSGGYGQTSGQNEENTSDTETGNQSETGGGGAGQSENGRQSANRRQPATQQAGADETNAVCPLNAGFNSAVSRLRAEEKAAGAKTVGSAAGAGAQGAGGGNAGSGAGDTGGATPPDDSADKNPPKPLEPEKPADWTRPKLCGETFCLKVEMVYKKESSHPAAESCIACHFEKINDNFKKLLDHGLVPSKVAGNLMEMPTCKRYSGALKFNLITIPQPIVTPPNDDLVVKGDFMKNMAGFINEYYLNKPAARAAESLLKQATKETDTSRILEKIAADTVDKAKTAAKFLKDQRLTSEAEDQASQYRVIMQEVDTMNSYFESFVQLFNQIADENKPDAPCPVLINLPQCS
ncbi:hypothetical protein HZA42_05855 [Candidatus Peregrinibacteria bacterium]|nr:hypothetical protein [Candidatus Peregrinibacteria bacterium]